MAPSWRLVGGVKLAPLTRTSTRVIAITVHGKMHSIRRHTPREEPFTARAGEPVGERFLSRPLGVSSQLFNIVACAQNAVKIVAPLWGAMPHLFAAKLRYVRLQQGLTLQQLADKVTFASYQYLWLLEKDQRSPSLEMVVLIAAFFQVSVDYFLRDIIAVDAPQIGSTVLLANAGELPRLFGLRLRTLRLQQGWSQTDLARKLNLKRRGYVSNLEAGRKTPSLDLVLQITDLFGTSTDFLLSQHPIQINQTK